MAKIYDAFILTLPLTSLTYQITKKIKNTSNLSVMVNEEEEERRMTFAPSRRPEC
jgi:hypothetical protein